MSTSDLAHQLAADGPALSARALAEMYVDPWWQERFGARGRRHADRDGDYHVQYLLEALAADDPGVFTRYACWLRDVLCARGMCSRHLAEHLTRLADAIAQAPWPERGRAVDILRAGVRSLAHVDGDAGVLEREGAGLVAAATAAVRAQHPGWQAPGGRRCEDELDTLRSYLADALALARPELFVQHVEHLAGFCQRQGLPASYLDAHLGALADALATCPELSTGPRARIEEARAGARKEPT